MKKCAEWILITYKQGVNSINKRPSNSRKRGDERIRKRDRSLHSYTFMLSAVIYLGT